MLWIAAAAVAFFIKGLCGFANTLVFTTILGYGTANVNISPVELLLGYPTNFILAWRNRKQLAWKVVIPLSVLILTGSIPGAVLLKNIDAQWLKIIFGVVVMLIGTEMLLRELKRSRIKESKMLLGTIGVLSGLLCGLFGVGALLAAYVGRVATTSDEFKANISAVFIVENTVRIILYIVLHVITIETVKTAAMLFPIMILGLLAGIKSAELLNESTVKRFVVVLLILSGAALVVNNV